MTAPTRRKRGNDEGSIRRRGPNRWEARYHDHAGRRRSLYDTTRAGVAAKLREALQAKAFGTTIDDPQQTVGQYLNYWLHAVASQRLRPRSLERYEGIIRKHIIPAIGSVQLAKLTPQRIEHFYASKRDQLATGSIRYIHQVLHAALAHAVRVRALSVNPAAGVAPPKPRSTAMKYLTADEARQFLTAIEGDPLEAMYVLAITTGMRLGEILGLGWEHVDLDRGSLQVRRALLRSGGQWQLAEPKTPGSRRKITLSQRAVTALRHHKARQAEHRLLAADTWTDHNLVFTGPFGDPVDGPRVTERRLRPILEAAGLPIIRFHDLRHTAATLMLEQGVHPKIVSEMLGHTSIAITVDRYSHVTPTMQDVAARQMDELLG